MKLKAAVFVNAIKVAYEQLSTVTSTADLHRIVMDVEQGNFVYFAKYFDTFYLRDGSGISDGAVLGFFKTLTDDSSLADFATRAVMKGLNDIGVFTDDEVIAFAKSLADTARIREAHAFAIGKPLSDQVANAEDHAFIFTKKVKEDAFALSDQINTIDVGKAEVDTAGAAEHYASDLSKPTADSSGVAENATLDTGKALAHTSQLSDQINTVDVGKALAHTSGAADAAAKSSGKPLSDAAGIASDETLDVTKVVADGSGATDTINYFAIAKALLDTVNVTDDVDGVASILDDQELAVFKNVVHLAGVSETFYRQVNFLRAYADTSAATDALAYDLARYLSETFGVAESISIGSQKPFTDNATLGSDQYEFNFGKAPSDSFTLSESVVVDSAKVLYDNSTAADVTSLHVSRTRSDTLAVSDVETLSPGKGLKELASTADTGSLRSQGYSDFTYFAEDYVGASRSF